MMSKKFIKYVKKIVVVIKNAIEFDINVTLLGKVEALHIFITRDIKYQNNLLWYSIKVLIMTINS